ncbi:MAG: zf-HC2 domain-containing protein [candidate division Zixibacteria bacterium]|nr:zf-HC2 domain-containing protein [candidate division Zixibacteria bacterium]
MRCDKYKEMLSARLDGELTEFETWELDSHLATCPDCRAFAAELDHISDLNRSTGTESLPADVEDRIMTRIDNAKNARKGWRVFSGYYRIPRTVVWIGSLVLAVLLYDALSGSNHMNTIIPGHGDAVSENSQTRKIVLTEKDVVERRVFTASKDHL